MIIDWNDFAKIDIRAGTIIDAREFPKARKPAYQLTIDFGENIGLRQSSAQLTKFYNISQLINRQIIAVLNFPPRQIADFSSECLVLGIYDENSDVILLEPERNVKNGCKIG
jgi:tRNA-binding protein